MTIFILPIVSIFGIYSRVFITSKRSNVLVTWTRCHLWNACGQRRDRTVSIATALILEKHRIDFVLNAGTAGGFSKHGGAAIGDDWRCILGGLRDASRSTHYIPGFEE